MKRMCNFPAQFLFTIMLRYKLFVGAVLLFGAGVTAFYPLIVKEHALVHHNYFTLHAKDWLNCIMSCNEDQRCVSYNYKYSATSNGICELNECGVDPNKPAEEVLIYTRGFVFQQLRSTEDREQCKPKVCPVGHYGDGITCKALSCRHIKIFLPSSPSDNYVIDPDGDGGLPSMTVYCDMVNKSGIGVTTISHDSEARTRVKGFEKPGSYYRNVTYTGASVTQLTALTRASFHCEQYIKYQCHLSVLTFKGIQYGWWVSRDGRKMAYWGGAPPGSGKCVCGVSNTCSKRCNCDANDRVWREDSGMLTSKNDLPVIQLRFGDTDRPYEDGYHTLGKLKCY